MSGLSSLAERYADEAGEDFGKVIDRWDGKPAKIAEDLFEVRLPDGTTKDLELFFPYQHKCMDAYFYGEQPTINVYKGRRIGISFVFMLCIFIDAISNPHTFYPVVSVKKGTAQNRIEDIYSLIDMCVLDIPVETDNKGYVELWNGAEIEAFSGSVDSDRGDKPAKAVFIDEMAFLDDQKETLRAFRAFLSLGENNKMIQVSTPKVKNDRFMQNNRDGSEYGDNGIIAIKQPSFKDPENVDIYTPLTEQDIEPVRPDMSLEQVEGTRAEDPEGFAQEFLCRPISDEYRFFGPDSIERAQERGARPDYVSGLSAVPQHGGKMVMGVDVGLISDDTVITVFEHVGDARRGKRYLRYYEVVTKDTIAQSGVREPDRANPNHVARRIADVYDRMDGQHLIYDDSGVGLAFRRIIQNRVGQGVIPFNFTNKEAVKQMAHDLNYGLRNDNVTLLPGETMRQQLEAIVKQKDEDYKTARFSGKEHGPEGKDDIAMALILGAYPSMLADGDPGNLKQKDREHLDPHQPEATEVPELATTRDNKPQRGQQNPTFGISSVSRDSGRRSYQRRHD